MILAILFILAILGICEIEIRMKRARMKRDPNYRVKKF